MKFTEQLKEIEFLDRDQLELRYRNLLLSTKMTSNEFDRLNKYILQLEAKLLKDA